MNAIVLPSGSTTGALRPPSTVSMAAWLSPRATISARAWSKSGTAIATNACPARLGVLDEVDPASVADLPHHFVVVHDDVRRSPQEGAVPGHSRGKVPRSRLRRRARRSASIQIARWAGRLPPRDRAFETMALRGVEPRVETRQSCRQEAPQLCWLSGLAGVGSEKGESVMRHRHFGQVGAVISFLVLCASVFMPGVTGVASAGLPDIPAPPGLPSFYSVPQPLPAGKAGTLIKYEVVSDPNLVGATLYLVMYKSKGPKGLVPVTGMVAVPDGNTARRRVARGELGSRDQRDGRHLRPSLQGSSQIPGANELVAAGYASRPATTRARDTRPDAVRRRCVGSR